MKSWSAALVDVDREHEWGKRLLETLAAHPRLEFDIQFESEDENQLHSPSIRVCINVGGFSAALTFLTADLKPETYPIGQILGVLCQPGRALPAIISLPTRSSRKVPTRHGTGDGWLPPSRNVDALRHTTRPLEGGAPDEDRAIQNLKEKLGLDQFVGRSPSLLAEIRKIPVIARSNFAVLIRGVLIRGETGTGKEICARAIHWASPRAVEPFVAINSGALPPELVENELFGHESGAFTGANRRASGLLQQANGGTLFLDEIDCLPLAAQTKLLRFLQDKQYRPLGSAKINTADLRIIAATNADLQALVRAGHFRRDLYYRLSVVELKLPPLRERGRDIDLLARHFLKRGAAEFNKPIPLFTLAALEKLASYDWPGNVRELENVVARTLVFARHNTIDADEIDLPQQEPKAGECRFKILKAQAVNAFEAAYLASMMQRHGGNITKAALAAGLQRTAFSRLLRKHGLSLAAAPRSSRQPFQSSNNVAPERTITADCAR